MFAHETYEKAGTVTVVVATGADAVVVVRVMPMQEQADS